jgi:hypothetical protein
MFRHYRVIFRELVINTLPSCTSVSNAAVSWVQLNCDVTRWRTWGKWRGNCRMELVASTLHTTSERDVSSITVYPALLPLMRTPRLPVVDWDDVPADLNGLVRFTERRKSGFCPRVPITFQLASNSIYNQDVSHRFYASPQNIVVEISIL